MAFTSVNIQDKDSILQTHGERAKDQSINLKDHNVTLYDRIVNDTTIHDSNFAFLTTTLSKLHTQLAEPKTFVTFRQDVPIDVGGGFVDFVTYYKVNWFGLMDEYNNLMGNNANYIPRVNASMEQNKVNVYTFEVAYDLRFVELEKMKKLEISKSLEQIYNDIIVAGFDLFSQRIAYLGNQAAGSHGLFNSPNVKKYAVPTPASGKAGDMGTWTDAEIISFINGIFAVYMTETNWNLGLLPDTLLVPSKVGQVLSTRTSELYNKNLRRYVEEFNFGMDEMDGIGSYKFKIRSRPDLDTQGTNGTGRIVVYRNEKSYVRLDMPYPLQSFYTGPNTERMAYTTFFVGQVSEIQMPYNTNDTEFGAVNYWDMGTN